MIFQILFCALFFVLSLILICLLVHFYKPHNKSSEDRNILQSDIDTIPMNIKIEDTQKKAVVLCSPDKKFQYKKYDYIGQKDCNIFKKFYDSPNECLTMCFGFGSCKAYCPEDAIVIKNKTAIITKHCNGCGKCINACPNSLIKLFPVEQKDIILCSNTKDGFKNCSACKQCNIVGEAK